jgi:coenzyme F420-reducing hydrogenase alpha subunit
MSRTILLQKATRIEGNANVQIEMDGDRVKSARFLVQEFRGFEGFLKGKAVNQVPSAVSRICGLCCVAHQVASVRAVEEALGIRTPQSVEALRDVMVLGEWISSHSLSYFFLAMPDLVGASGGIFEMVKNQPKISAEAFALRACGMRIVELLGKRTIHPVTVGLGRFLSPPQESDLIEIQNQARIARKKAESLIMELGETYEPSESIQLPEDLQVNFVTYSRDYGQDRFVVYDRQGTVRSEFSRTDMLDHVGEISTEWTLAKTPYLKQFGFPDGIMLVGPLSRSFSNQGFMCDEEVAHFKLSEFVADRAMLTLDKYDVCRLLEIFWAAKRIEALIEGMCQDEAISEIDTTLSGRGIGVLEAPRGILMHSYLVNRGFMERMNLLVATQFNNAYINVLITDLVQNHINGGSISPEGEYLVGRCIRLFDPCLSCATH